MTYRHMLLALLEPRASFDRAFKATETYNGLDGSKHYTWRATRRQNINKLTFDVINITAFLVVAGTLGSPPHAVKVHEADVPQVGNGLPDYGIVYHLGRCAYWAFSLLIAMVVGVLWFPILKWFNPPKITRTTTAIVTDENGISHTVTKEISVGVMRYLELANKYMFTGLAYLRVLEFILHLRETILHVNARPVRSPSSTSHAVELRNTWLARLGLVAGMFMGVGMGALVMSLWYWLELVHVTWHEYALIIVPAQMTIGIVSASVLQAAFEKNRPLPVERDLFEQGADGQLTLEGMRQAFSFLVNSDVDMKQLQEIAAKKNEDKKEKIEIEKNEKIDEEDHGEVKREEKNDEKVGYSASFFDDCYHCDCKQN